MGVNAIIDSAHLDFKVPCFKNMSGLTPPRETICLVKTKHSKGLMSEHSKIFWLFLKTPHFHMASKPQKHISIFLHVVVRKECHQLLRTYFYKLEANTYQRDLFPTFSLFHWDVVSPQKHILVKRDYKL